MKINWKKVITAGVTLASAAALNKQTDTFSRISLFIERLEKEKEMESGEKK